MVLAEGPKIFEKNMSPEKIFVSKYPQNIFDLVFK